MSTPIEAQGESKYYTEHMWNTADPVASLSSGSPPRSLPSPLSQAAKALEEAAASRNLQEEEWERIASAAKTIADGLKNGKVSSSSRLRCLAPRQS